MVKKILNLAAAFVVFAVGALCFAPVRAWASQEGSYLYHQFFLTGPAVIYAANVSYTGSDGTARRGVEITSGTITAPSSVHQRWLGALATKPSTSVEGDEYWDSTQHAVAIATCTASSNACWLKGNTATTGSAWTLY